MNGQRITDYVRERERERERERGEDREAKQAEQRVEMLMYGRANA